MNEVVTQTPAPLVASHPMEGASVTPMQLLSIAVNQNADLDKLSRLMDLQERWERNEARKQYHIAFAEFKRQAITIVRNKLVTDGPLKSKKYADLFAVVNTLTPLLSQHGLSASWRLSKDEKDWIEVTCTITHIGGHSESVPMGGPPDSGGAKNPIQARASTVSYLERYTLLAAVGAASADQDTDGNTGEKAVEPDLEGKKALEACGDMQTLQKVWKGLTAAQRSTLNEVKESCKTAIQDADKRAAA